MNLDTVSNAACTVCCILIYDVIIAKRLHAGVPCPSYQALLRFDYAVGKRNNAVNLNICCV